MCRNGFAEKEVLEFPLDKLEAYIRSVRRQVVRDRQLAVMDMAGAIGGMFGKKDALSEYIESIGNDNGD